MFGRARRLEVECRDWGHEEEAGMEVSGELSEFKEMCQVCGNGGRELRTCKLGEIREARGKVVGDELRHYDNVFTRNQESLTSCF